MKTPEEKSELMRQQVIAKIHWGADDQEVLNWLEERHGIAGAHADKLLAEAHRAKRRAVRQKALLSLVFSAIGVALVVGFITVQFLGSFVVIGVGSVLIVGIGFICLIVFFRSLHRLLTGDVSGSVD